MTRLRASWWLAPAGVAASLMAAVLMTAALFPTFAGQGCPGCSAFVTGGLPSATLRASSDAWAVVWVIGVLAATAILVLGGVASRLAAVVNAFAAFGGLGLAVYEGAVAFPGSLPAELVPHVPVFYVLDAGYYLFLGGGLVAVGAAGVMLLVRGDRERELAAGPLTGPRVTTIASWGCLAALGVAGVGAFLPFAGLNCGFGCPPFGGPFVLVSGALVGGADGAVILALLIAAACAIAVRMTGHGNPLASTIALVLTLAVTALVSVESLNAATRVLRWPYGIPTAPEQGYYVLQAGAAIAAVLAVLLVSADRPTWRLQRPSADTSREAIRPA